MSRLPKPSEAEFDELKRRRDESMSTLLRTASIQLFGTDAGVTVHINQGGNSPECYCGCPDGPCQHEWTGPWREFEDGHGGEATCARCGAGAMHHDLHTLDF